MLSSISGARYFPKRVGHRLVLYMIYYPQNLKYVEVYAGNGREGGRDPQLKITKVKTDGWSLSITLSWVVFVHT